MVTAEITKEGSPAGNSKHEQGGAYFSRFLISNEVFLTFPAILSRSRSFKAVTVKGANVCLNVVLSATPSVSNGTTR